MKDRLGQTFLIPTMVLTLTAVALFSTNVKAESFGLRTNDGRTVSVSVPEDCGMKRTADGQALTCNWQATDGGYRNVVLQSATLSLSDFSRQFRVDSSAFAANPSKYMGAVLRKVEELATGEPPGPGQMRIRADAEIVSAARTPKGLDKCLRFEFDWSGSFGDGSMARTDSSGVRCLEFDGEAERITFVMLESMNTHLTGLESRQTAYQREAKRIVESLRLV